MHYPGQIIPRFLSPPLNQRESPIPPQGSFFLTIIPVEMGWTELWSGLDFFSGFFLVFKLFNFTVFIPMDLSNVFCLSQHW